MGHGLNETDFKLQYWFSPLLPHVEKYMDDPIVPAVDRHKLLHPPPCCIKAFWLEEP